MLSRLAKICVLSLWQDSLKLNVGLISMFFLYSQSASDTMLNRKKSNKKGLARWLSWLEHHLVHQRLRVQFLVRAHNWVVGSIPGSG